MRNEHMDCIPTSLICKWWTKGAKSDIIKSSQLEEMDTGMTKVARYGALVVAYNRLCHIASQDSDAFHEVREEIFKMTNKLEKQMDQRSKRGSSAKDIGDPTVVNTRGASLKKKFGNKRRRCSNCNRTGHIIRTCPRLVDNDELCTQDDDLSPAESLGLNREVGSGKEGTRCDENYCNQTVSTNQSISHKDKKSEVIPSFCGRKAEISPGPSVLILPTPQNVAYGYGSLSQGMPMYPMYCSYGAYCPQIPKFRCSLIFLSI